MAYFWIYGVLIITAFPIINVTPLPLLLIVILSIFFFMIIVIIILFLLLILIFMIVVSGFAESGQVK